jgi:chromosome segregation ATPase
VEGRDVSDRQLEALLDRLDRIQRELERLNRRLEANEGFLQVTRELRNLNESLNALAYAALGRSPQVRRRRTG